MNLAAKVQTPPMWTRRGSPQSEVRAGALLSLVLLGCAPQVDPNAADRFTGIPGLATEAAGPESRTFSPRASPGAASARVRALLKLCGQPEGGLMATAGQLAAKLAQSTGPSDEDLTAEMRRQGVPYVWPRIFSLRASDDEGAGPAVRRWLLGWSGNGTRRCGVGVHGVGGGERQTVVIVVDSVAELDPFVRRAALGQRVSFAATLSAPTQAASVVALDPQGRPRPVPSSRQGARVISSFAPDQAGHWVLQLVTTVAGGPRPALEAWLTVGAAEPGPQSVLVPGETLYRASDPPEDALLAMANQARRSAGSRPVTLDRLLSELARRQADKMRKQQRLSHDWGDGGPVARTANALPAARRVGENLAYARTVLGGHRALWASPSHRENLLDPRFSHVGVGVATDPAGGVWICELFAELP